MKKSMFTLTANNAIAPGVYEMTLSGDTEAITAPGQFVQIAVPGFYLRRPISVCNVEAGSLTIIYKVVGSGTETMSKMENGEQLELLTGLGNGYDISLCGARPLLIGGGAGVPPMYQLAKELIANGAEVSVILGFNKKEEVFYEENFKALGAKTFVTTVDGSYGIRGFVTDAMDLDYSYVCACGPEPMLRAVYNRSVTSGAFSFEERMGCGFGACMGCSCKTKYGNKRICKDGPVLQKEEIIW